jgi:hypothetical protein
VPHEQDHRHRPGQQPRSAAITPAEGHPRQAGQQDQAEQGATKVDLALVGAQESGIGLDRAGPAQTRLVGLERGPVTPRAGSAMGRCRGGRRKHSRASDGGGLVAAHSAKVITRPYRNTPPELVMA